MPDNQILTRDQIDPKYQWDVSDLFESDEEFVEKLERVEESLPKIATIQGSLNESPGQLVGAIEVVLNASRRIDNLIVYASLKNDQDQTNPKYQAYHARAQQLSMKFDEATAFMEPEIINISERRLKGFMERSERLQSYTHYLENIRRSQVHVFDKETESMIAQAGEVFRNPSHTFALLNNADFDFPVIQDSQGNDIKLSHGVYNKLLENTDRNVRKAAFEGYYSVYGQFKNTLASTLSGLIKTNNYLAKIRGYDSARQRALFNNAIPEQVYETLVKTVNKRIAMLHRYVDLRERLLGIDDLEMYDMYTPLLGKAPISFTFEEAKEVVLKALAPLGEEYLSVVKKAFTEGWIDVYENQGKRSGAYSSGSYNSKPYILMNWQDNLSSLYTLVHELGHSVHSYLTRQNQPYVYGDYPIFLAEIASTTNENLLTSYLKDNYNDKEVKLYVLNQFLDGMKGTMFRQTQFAEFEQFMYSEDAKGTPLTAEFLSENYRKLNRKYYGVNVNSNSAIEIEWSRIPHFYYNFYVFQYATGFAAATAFADGINHGDKKMLEDYLKFLKTGSSKYAIDVMKEAGVDMTQSDYIHACLDVFERRVVEFEDLLD